LGVAQNNGGSNYNGLMDDIRVYNRVLSAAEIRKLYNLGTTKVAVTPADPLKRGLVGWWTFDGKNTHWDTATTDDLSGNGNTGALISMSTSSTPIAGKIGQALKFDGVNDGVSTPYDIGTGDISVCAWINPTDLSAAYPIIDNTQFQFFTNNQNGVEYDGPTVTEAVSSINVININSWQHVCLSLSSGDVANIYVNGILSGSANQIVGTRNTSVFNTSIGIYGTLAGGFFPGSIDDVRIYSRILSAQEINRLYNLGR